MIFDAGKADHLCRGMLLSLYDGSIFSDISILTISRWTLGAENR